MKYSNGMVNLSRKAAKPDEAAWDIIESAMEKGADIEGVISGKTKGGLSVDILGVTAFRRDPQIDVRVVSDPDSLISKRMLLKF